MIWLHFAKDALARQVRGLMCALGQKRTSGRVRIMSALPPKADIRPRDQDVCFGPAFREFARER